VADGARDATGARERLATTLRRGAAWLAAQLVVVFLGVYAASWLADRQAAAERDRRRAQLRRALVTELRDMTAGTRNAAEGTGRLLAFYDSAWKAGGHPRLQPILDPIRVSPQMWQATVAGGGLELLDVATFYRLSEFYNELAGGFDLLEQLQRLSESQLLPVTGAPGARFYDAATGKLRPEYAWYPMTTRRLNAVARRLTARGDSLAAQLEREGR
jgi:hypothetical protein